MSLRLAALALLLPLTTSAASPQWLFEDVSPDHPNAQAIQYAYEEGIVEGYFGGTFAPNGWIIRAEFAKMIAEAFLPEDGIERCLDRNPGDPFPDVDANNWYGKYICALKEAGVMKGYPDGRFRLERYVNVAEAAAILSRMLWQTPDSETWYLSHAEALAMRNALPLSLRSFFDPIKRGEVAEIIWRLKTENASLPSHTTQSLMTSSSRALPYTYDPATVRVGEQYGKMFVVSETVEESDGVIRFAGDVIVSGKYDDDRDNHGMNYAGICLSNLTPQSRVLIPGGGGFCLESGPWERQFPRGSRGQATVRIRSLVRYHIGAEVTDTAEVVEVLSVIPEPQNASACAAAGGQWDGNAVYRERITELGNNAVDRGVCYLPDSPYFGKLLTFDGCGSGERYSNQPWFPAFKQTMYAAGVDHTAITEACYSAPGHLFIFFVRGEGIGWQNRPCARNTIYQYDTKENVLRKARMPTEQGCFAPDEFLKREGHIIPVRSVKSGENCRIVVDEGTYNYVLNTAQELGGYCE